MPPVLRRQHRGHVIFAHLFPLSAALPAGGAVAAAAPAAAALAPELPPEVADQVDHRPQDEQGHGGVNDVLHNVLLQPTMRLPI